MYCNIQSEVFHFIDKSPVILANLNNFRLYHAIELFCYNILSEAILIMNQKQQINNMWQYLFIELSNNNRN
jgi:hypothetical protein